MVEAIYKSILVALLIYGAAAEVKTRYYPRYHLAPPCGWMNDPNGLSYYKDEYHLFYQFNPNSSESAGIAHWGHIVSTDLVDWEHLPIAIKPDQTYDKTGVFSGSGITVNDTLYLIYTGNVNFPDKTPDHRQVQALAHTTDGVNITKYEGNPIIEGNEFQPDLRDPKVWKYEDNYYMILGNSIENTTGQVLLHKSSNLVDWKFLSVLLKSNGSLGYMWECPDIFELGNYYILLFSPQGILPQGDKYKNLYQCGYITGKLDYKTGIFTPVSEFYQMDEGCDFYATQTILDKKGRRIMLAWMDMWEQYYPERADGATGQQTLPRELVLSSNGRILQKPIEELDRLKGKKLYSGVGKKGHIETLPDKTGKVTLHASNSSNFSLHIQDASNSSNEVVIYYDYKEQSITVDRKDYDGLRRTHWNPDHVLKLTIYIDASSIEIFCGEGEITFTDRFFPKGDIVVKLEADAYYYIIQTMERSVPLPNSEFCSG